MKKILVTLNIIFSLSAFSQTQQISIGYGINNANKEEFTPSTVVDYTNFIGAVNYHYIFKNKIEIHGAFAYSRYSTLTYTNAGVVYDKMYSLNVGPMYHFYTNNHFDFSSGFSVGLKYKHSLGRSTAVGSYTNNKFEGVYGINL